MQPAASSQLRCLHLKLSQHQGPHPHVLRVPALLAQGCRQLRQLTLQGMGQLSTDMLRALMLLPELRLLRLLGCCGSAASQEACQALLGQLRCYQLQVAVVEDAVRSAGRWMVGQLAEGWRQEQ